MRQLSHVDGDLVVTRVGQKFDGVLEQPYGDRVDISRGRTVAVVMSVVAVNVGRRSREAVTQPALPTATSSGVGG